MALSNERFVTTWTSEDAIQYRLYIIPSSVDYISPGLSSDVTLPTEFLLRDMKLDTDIGDIPAGLTSQVLKLNVNLAALQGAANLVSLREDLLRGTTTLKYPKTSAGANVTAAGQFKAFNTFILQYDDGSGYKTMFIGCQKFSAENQLEITSLQNVVSFSLEIYDVTRCIGEAITETAWCEFLQNISDTTGGLVENENTFYTQVANGYDYRPTWGTPGKYWALDVAPGGMNFRIQRLDKLFSKINEMYSSYLRTLTQKTGSSYSMDQIWSLSMEFYKLRADNNTAPSALSYYPFIITEIWNDKGEIIGGAFRDSTVFAQYKNFHDVLKSLFEQSLQTYRLSYSQSGSNPQSYTVTYTADYVLPQNFYSLTPFARSNIYGSVKVKLLSETLNQMTLNVSTLKGRSDVESYIAANQSTASDDGKDINVMFHNYPVVTDREVWNDTEEYNYSSLMDEGYFRNAVSAGMLVYVDDTSGRVKKIDTKCGVNGYFTSSYEPDYYFQAADGYTEGSLFKIYMYFEQTKSASDSTKGAGLCNVIAQTFVDIFGNPKQAIADFATTFGVLKFTGVGMSCIIDYNDLNPLLSSIYGTNTANAVVLKTSHDVYSGMVDTTIRIHGLDPA